MKAILAALMLSTAIPALAEDGQTAAQRHEQQVDSVHLNAYAGEMAWREDHRRKDNGTLFQIVAGAALGHVKSQRWCGYWQR